MTHSHRVQGARKTESESNRGREGHSEIVDCLNSELCMCYKSHCMTHDVWDMKEEHTLTKTNKWNLWWILCEKFHLVRGRKCACECLEWLVNNEIIQFTCMPVGARLCANGTSKLLSSSNMNQMVKRLTVCVLCVFRLLSFMRNIVWRQPNLQSALIFISMNNVEHSIFHCFIAFIIIVISFIFFGRPPAPSGQFEANHKFANKLPNKNLRCIIFIIRFC